MFLRREGFQLAITTKSDLVARDAELLAAVAARNRVRVNMTVTTMDADLARMLEPTAPRPDLRLGALAALARAGVEVGVAASPVMPGINDGAASLEAVARAAQAVGAGHLWAQPVFLKACALAVFLPFLEERFPHLARAYRAHFARKSHIGGEYEACLRATVQALKNKYGLRRTAPAIPWSDGSAIEPGPSGSPEILGRYYLYSGLGKGVLNVLVQFGVGELKDVRTLGEGVEFVAHMEVVQTCLQHVGRRIGHDRIRTLGGRNQKLLHLGPRCGVPDGNRRVQH